MPDVCIIHDWQWTGTVSGPGAPTRDRWICEKCGKEKEVPRDG